MQYYENPYLKEIEVNILKREGNRFLLEDTILYPGGGGQPPDEGYVICNDKKFHIMHIGNLWHEIEGDCQGRVKIVLNWERRYLLMRSHTAEHTFFRILENKGARMGKIALGEISSIIFEGEIEIEDILEAEEKTRKLISEGRKVRTFWIRKEDLENYPDLRIKLSRINDESIRVVEIEAHDLSACKGVHVSNLSEIEDFAIVSVKMGKRKEVKFLVGSRAREFHAKGSRKLRELMWHRNLDMDKVERYVKNIEEDNERMLSAFRELSKDMDFHRESYGALEIHTLYLPYGDYKTLQRRAMEIANHKDAVVIYGLGNVVCMAFNPKYEWVRDEYLALLSRMSGRGGGKGNFLSGSASDGKAFVENLKRIICEKAIRLHGGENGSD